MREKKFWEYFDQLREVVYVSDIDTHELIYLNKKGRSELGLDLNAPLDGQKCYSTLQHCSKPCAICNSEILSNERFEKWQYYNPVVRKNYILLDTLLEDNGRRCRMEIAVDITEPIRNETIIEKNQDISRLLVEGLRIMYNQTNLDDALLVLLEYIGKTLGGEKVYIFERNAEGNMDNTYEWTAVGIESQKDSFQNIPNDVAKSWLDNFENNDSMIITDLEEVKDSDPGLYEMLKPQDIVRLVAIPISDRNGDCYAFCGVDNMPADKVNITLEMLQLIKHFAHAIIVRRNLMRKLNSMSYEDQLTGLGNRYALNEYYDKVDKNGSLGVVYCDITGLKHINDTQGHQAGDQLILRACNCLTTCFSPYKIFRIGGDEILVLCSKTDEEELKKRIECLKTELEENDVVMSVGVSWADKCGDSVSRMISEAEEKMYEAKRLYYIAESANMKTEIINNFDSSKNRTMLHHERFIKTATKLLELNGGRGTCYLLSLDISEFKMINYHYGISGGNELLKAFEDYLTSLPLQLYYERIFADCFLILQIDKKLQSDEEKLEKCKHYEDIFIESQQKKYPACNLRLCCGITRIRNNNLVEAIDNANIARREGKRNNNSVTFSNDKYNEHIKSKQLEREIAETLKEERFTFFLQPQNDMNTGEIIGAEALARGYRPDGEMVYPDVFIPVLEENGSIVELDLLIIRQVCEHLSERLKQGLPVVKTSVNLSRIHAYTHNTAERINGIVSAYKIPKELLLFELTESVFVEDISGMQRLCKDLNDFGYKIAIDDFGAGYAGFNLWNDFSFSQVKLDRQFLIGTPDMIRHKMAIVAGVLEIGKLLDTQVLCEGVEQSEQTKQLLDVGCNYAQGYYFSKPMPQKDFYQYMDNIKKNK